jgi:hypothetical protein
MMGLDYKVDNAVSKTIDVLALWHSEKGLVEIDKDTLAVGIRRNEKEAEYVFCGHGRLLIDTIVETDEGAMGKPVEKELNQPFIMFSNTKEIHQHLSIASDEDVARIGYPVERTLSLNQRISSTDS